MKKVVVIGGGLSGLSAAVFLTSKKIPVTLIESSNRLGGRVSSYYDNLLGEELDNGQHIMMGCYNETLHYIKLIGIRSNFFFQDSLEINFLKNGSLYQLKSGRGVFPLDLMSGLLSFRLLSLRERFELLRFLVLLPLSSRRDIEKITAEEWLTGRGQSLNTLESFWNVFIIGALNTTPSKASAALLRKVLLQVFFSGRNSASIIIPAKPLTEAFCTPAVQYLNENGSEVCLSERVIKLEADERKKKITRIITSRRIISGFSYVVSAVPLYALKKIIRYETDFSPAYSPILTVHFRSGVELFSQKFVAVLNSPIHWIFRHPGHYTVVISSAGELINKTNEEIATVIISEISKMFSILAESISALRIIKEKRATFIPSPEILNTRPGNLTDYYNFFLAGDWTNTGLPATIEGAVLSGRKAAEYVTQL